MFDHSNNRQSETGLRKPGKNLIWRSATLRIAIVAVLSLLALAILPIASSQARVVSTEAGAANNNTSKQAPQQGAPSPNSPDRHLPLWMQRSHEDRPLDITTTNWTNLYPDLLDVSAVSGSEAWAVGEYGHLAHYTNTTWTTLDSITMRNVYLYDIDMVSPSSGWVMGSDNYTDQSKAFQYDGASWAERSNGLSYDANLRRISAVSADDVWGIKSYYYSYNGPLLHWNGTGWMNVNITPVITYQVSLQDIAMASPTDGWAVGYAYPGASRVGIILRYNGTDWTQFSSVPTNTNELNSVWSGVPGEVWASGYDTTDQSWIYHYSGGSWTSYAVPANTYVYRIFMLNNTEGWATTSSSLLHFNGTSWNTENTGLSSGNLNGISGAGGQTWAVGSTDTILSRTGGSWGLQHGGPTTSGLNAVSAINANQAWAVGSDYDYYSGRYTGTILAYTGATGMWTTTTVPSNVRNSALYDVQAISSTDAYAVGDGVIARYQSGAWTRVATLNNVTLYGVSMTSNCDGWAVGRDNNSGGGAALIHASGCVWALPFAPILPTLYTVAMDSPTHGWAAGGYEYGNYQPVMLEYTGTNWISYPLPAGSPAIIYKIALAPGGNDGWAVGTRGSGVSAILHLHNGVWAIDYDNDISSLRGVAMDANGDAWAVGGGSGVYHYHPANGWEYHPLPTNGSAISALAIVPGRVGWAVGSFGHIYRYDSPYLPTPTPTSTATSTPTFTPTRTVTPVDTVAPTQSITPVGTVAPTQTTTPATCPINFTDVNSTDYFYTPVQYLFCQGVVSGYGDTFLPNNNTTRGQLTKIVSLALGWNDACPATGHFTDVPKDSAFFCFIETAYAHGIIGGYAGSTGNTFKPNDDVTRGQLCKIVQLAFGWADDLTGAPHFTDVQRDSTFYKYIETSYNHHIISGYGDTFRPTDSATRAQICKIVYNAILAR